MVKYLRCVVCGSLMESKYSKRTCCSQRCYYRMYRKRGMYSPGGRYYVNPHGAYNKVCDECGSTFKHSQPHAKYCSLSCKRKRSASLYKSRSSNVVDGFTDAELSKLITESHGCCNSCGRFVGVDSLEVDHIIPKSRAPPGFVYEIGHIQLLCHSCNCSKCDRI